jgi:parvulin-like peptidyl-prolyl isomerase
MPDLAELTRVNKGFEKHVTTLWEKEYSSSEKVDALLNEKREQLESGYIKVAHIFFNSYQDPEFYKDKVGVTKKKKAQAEKAWERIRGGESFSDVAKDVSQDKVTRLTGGSLGSIPDNQFGPDFREAARKLKVGEFCRPVQSPWGVHVIKREEMTDDDLRGVLKSQFMEGMGKKIIRELKDSAKIVKSD